MAEEIVVQPGPVEGIDTWTKNYPGLNGYDRPTDNGYLRTGGWGDSSRVFLKFDITNFPLEVESAVIWLYYYPIPPDYFPIENELERVMGPWDETVTWLSQPNSEYLRTLPKPGPDSGWYKIDITDIYDNWKNGVYPNYGISLIAPCMSCWSGSKGAADIFYSSDYMGNPELRPMFVITTAEISVDIDIKPGSEPNCFNNDGHGVIPVAILGSEFFDATNIDPETVRLDGQTVKAVGKSNKALAHIEDSNGDGINDMVVQIEDDDGVYDEGSSIGTITGETYDGVKFQGTDSLCIVP